MVNVKDIVYIGIEFNAYIYISYIDGSKVIIKNSENKGVPLQPILGGSI